MYKEKMYTWLMILVTEGPYVMVLTPWQGPQLCQKMAEKHKGKNGHVQNGTWVQVRKKVIEEARFALFAITYSSRN
jgi:hypothetical protein